MKLARQRQIIRWLRGYLRVLLIAWAALAVFALLGAVLAFRPDLPKTIMSRVLPAERTVTFHGGFSVKTPPRWNVGRDEVQFCRVLAGVVSSVQFGDMRCGRGFIRYGEDVFQNSAWQAIEVGSVEGRYKTTTLALPGDVYVQTLIAIPDRDVFIIFMGFAEHWELWSAILQDATWEQQPKAQTSER